MRVGRGFGFAGPACVHADNSVAARSVMGPRIDCASSPRAAGYCLRLSACTPSTSRAIRSFLSAWSNAFRELDRFVDIAVRQQRERAAEQLDCWRVAPQARPDNRRPRRPHRALAGMAGGEIAAGRGRDRENSGGGSLSRRSCPDRQRHRGKATALAGGHGRTPQS